MEGNTSLLCKDMHMSLHKAIGYGIDDILFADSCCIDDRILHHSYLHHPDNYNIEAFREYTKDEYSIPWETTLKDVVHFSNINGKNTFCIVIPEEVRESHRIDDLMDISTFTGTATFRCKDGLPGHNEIMNAKTGKKISRIAWTIFIREFNMYHSPGRCEAQRILQESTLCELASDLGYDTVEDAIAFTIPAIPLSVIRLAEYLNIFNTDRAVFSLRPLVYTYWK